MAALGFTGCISVVHFNSISPLKAALLHPDTSPVIITGPLVQSNCGSSASSNPYAAENTHHLSGKRGGVSFVGQFVISNVSFEIKVISFSNSTRPRAQMSGGAAREGF